MPSDRTATLNALRQRIAEMPATPGVYLFKDASGVVLYVGKAKTLRGRVASYFQPAADLRTTRGPDIARMIEQLVEEIDWLECESEVDALLRESRLIKDIQPRFNKRERDEKTFPYLQINSREDFPRVCITREPKRGAKLYGPFASPKDLRAALPLLQRVFRFRTCTLEISEGDDARRHFRPCILWNIKQCTAPCGARVSQEAYARQIDHLRRFLESKGTELRKELTAEMAAASNELNFERAAELRDELRALEGLQKRGLVQEHVQPEVFYVDPAEGLAKLGEVLGMPAPPRTIEGVDIAHLAGRETCGALVSFIDGKPFKSGYRRYKIQSHDRNDDYQSIREVVWRRYKLAGMHEELFPDVILVDGGKGQLAAAWAAFDGLETTPPMLASLAKRDEELFVMRAGAVEGPVKLARRNPALRLLQSVRDEAHRFAQSYHHILRRKATMGEGNAKRRGRKDRNRDIG